MLVGRGMTTVRVLIAVLALVAFCVFGCSTRAPQVRERQPDPTAGAKPTATDTDDAKAPNPKAQARPKSVPTVKIPEITAVTIEEFLKRYDTMLNDLRAELKAKVPRLDPAKRQAYTGATKAVAAASEQIKKAERIKDKKEREEKLKAARDARTQAKDDMRKALENLELGEFLASDALDAKLAKYVVLLQATPKGLAEYAGQSRDQALLVERMLVDTDLMKQMLVADGARAEKNGPAQYGPAMKLYIDIQNASDRANEGVLQRLALAVALQHSVAVKQSNPKTATNAPATVDPVKRYLQYEKAYLGGELDPAFEGLSAWELRFVVDGDEPDSIAVWGREMLRNFHPDQIYTEDYGWRYVSIVKTDVKYGSGGAKYNRPELHFFQNTVMNGGVCGPRAFFGRFILRAFGIPTTARPSRGHAALAHWTPKGWVVNLGRGWGAGRTSTRYKKDVDFLASTQARNNRDAYLQVKRAYWVGDVFGEKRTYGEHDGIPALWSAVALHTQRSIIEEAKAETLKALGEDIGEASESTVAEKVMASPVTPEDRKVIYGAGDAISIPAAAYSKPSGNTREVQAMKSFAGGLQIFLPRFFREGKTIMRGGAWKGNAKDCASGTRCLSGGRGAYDNWGFRAAVTVADNDPKRELTLDLGDGVAMEFVYIKPGTFVMGGESTEDGRFQCVEVPRHKVTITRGFFLGRYEVTQAQYQAVMGSKPGKSTRTPDLPAGGIGRPSAVEFCEKAAERTGRDVRLPTEAEWEYACRAGSETKWFFGDDPSPLGDYAWFKDNDGGRSHPVGQKKPNPWGLYDIYGNVCERVSDTYARDYYSRSPDKDPTGAAQAVRSRLEYRINVPRAGRYSLTARVVTVNYNQQLVVSANDDESDIIMEMPYTCGTWKDCEPVTLSLKKGENTLNLLRRDPPQYGVAIKSFELRPVR